MSLSSDSRERSRRSVCCTACFDLTDTFATSQLELLYRGLGADLTAIGRLLPENEPAGSTDFDLVLRFLDCVQVAVRNPVCLLGPDTGSVLSTKGPTVGMPAHVKCSILARTMRWIDRAPPQAQHTGEVP